jgi:hypothetical protein
MTRNDTPASRTQVIYSLLRDDLRSRRSLGRPFRCSGIYGEFDAEVDDGPRVADAGGGNGRGA